ncbi:MAG: Xaa-Pro aminopeptidase [Gammaproteobacteria bacterium GWE2_42_36]|nr:MAG: Xaa-Pro aminopeptidase [Gammaproteobacteria bacterium GWE2_42_36]HCU05927.1 Xaa-Pro aminopeptidase [Coxiellaceae bacterium]
MLPQSIFKERRRQLLANMLPDSIAILFTAPEHVRNGDEYFSFRPSSDFYYLTGFNEPEAVAIFLKTGEQEKFILFNRVRDPHFEQWFGYRLGQMGAIEQLGADEAHAVHTLNEKMPILLSQAKHLYYAFGLYPQFDQQLDQWLYEIRSQIRSGLNAPYQMINVESILHEMRLLKSPEEIKLMEKSASINVQAHLRAMKLCQAGRYEYEVEAELIHEFKRQNAREETFGTIIASGENSCILHYRANDRQIRSGDLVLVDSGCEYFYYGSDMTRTYPANGRFTVEQKMIYELVLRMQAAGLACMKPGNAWNQAQEAAIRVLTEGLCDLGLLKGDVDGLIEQEAYFPFYMHRFSHWLGLDGHDAGSYKVDGIWRPLQSGMMLSAEPGLYIKAGMKNVDERWWNIGVRIEDMVLITKTGYSLLSAEMPKEIDAIEQAMAD